LSNAVQEFFERRVTFDAPRAHESNVFIPSEKERVALSALNIETRESDDEFKSSPYSSVAQTDISPYKASPNLFKQEGFFSKLAIIGQLGELYIVCESERGMILIDQHAAHERIRYEKTERRLPEQRTPNSGTLFPIVIHLSPSEFQILKECGQDIKSLGIEIEEFGTDSFIVRSVPALIKGANVEKLVKDIIEEIAVLGEEKSLSERIDHIIATMACHSSIRANSELGREKIKSLLDELDRARFPLFLSARKTCG
jgi:DNA mismatch repair enzyme (predicted ATPase)